MSCILPRMFGQKRIDYYLSCRRQPQMSCFICWYRYFQRQPRVTLPHVFLNSTMCKLLSPLRGGEVLHLAQSDSTRPSSWLPRRKSSDEKKREAGCLAYAMNGVFYSVVTDRCQCSKGGWGGGGGRGGDTAQVVLEYRCSRYFTVKILL